MAPRNNSGAEREGIGRVFLPSEGVCVVRGGLCEREGELALRAANATGARFAGVDLLYRRDGTCYVIEVNAVPGWRAFERVSGVDVAAAVVSSLELHRC